MAIQPVTYDAADTEPLQGCIHVFDFDGVIIDPMENDIYSLPELPSEHADLEAARRVFGIRCEDMKLAYQRHLIFQAALFVNKRMSEPGPALDLFRNASRQGGAFVLTARSGWHATERVRQFMVESDIQPVETFHVGRVPKWLQLVHLLDEFPDKTIRYFEDSQDHVDKIAKYFSDHPSGAERLSVCFVARIGERESDDALRALFNAELETAHGIPARNDA